MVGIVNGILSGSQHHIEAEPILTKAIKISGEGALKASLLKEVSLQISVLPLSQRESKIQTLRAANYDVCKDFCSFYIQGVIIPILLTAVSYQEIDTVIDVFREIDQLCAFIDEGKNSTALEDIFLDLKLVLDTIFNDPMLSLRAQVFIEKYQSLSDSPRIQDLFASQIGCIRADFPEDIEGFSYIRNLTISNRIGVDGAKVLTEVLKVNTALTSLNLWGNQIGDEGASALSAALKVNTGLTRISLVNNLIGADGARALADALNFITSLYLSHNQIGVDGARVLAEALELNISLTRIDLSSNQIRDDGARALAEVLKVNTGLASINLTDNQIGVDGARALAEALKVNTSLTRINVVNNQIGADGARALAEALKVNTSLTSIILWGNQIGVDGARALAAALEVNTSLISISLVNNQIRDDGARALAAVLTVNRALTCIDLSGNQIGADVKKMLGGLSYETLEIQL